MNTSICRGCSSQPCWITEGYHKISRWSSMKRRTTGLMALLSRTSSWRLRDLTDPAPSWSSASDQFGGEVISWELFVYVNLCKLWHCWEIFRVYVNLPEGTWWYKFWLVVTGTWPAYFPINSWEWHHPNWRTPIFQRDRLNHQPVPSCAGTSGYLNLKSLTIKEPSF